MYFFDLYSVSAIAFKNFSFGLDKLTNERLHLILAHVRHSRRDRQVRGTVSGQDSERRTCFGTLNDAIFAVAGGCGFGVLQGARNIPNKALHYDGFSSGRLCATRLE
jgi:hypothetical protein